MIANLLPSEAIRSPLDLFLRLPLLVTFDGSFYQKLSLIYSPIRFIEAAFGRNNCIDLKIFPQRNCRTVQFSKAYLNYESGITVDIKKNFYPAIAIFICYTHCFLIVQYLLMD